MQFVLVSAANANDLMLNKSFYYCVQPRQDYLFSKYRGKDDLVLTWFEVTSGLCQQVTMDRKGKRSKLATLKRFKPVTRASYERRGKGWAFRDGQPDIMSIVDVYRFVEDQVAHSIFEVSIFCHAWEGGPVIVDSYDDRHYKDASGKTVWIRDEARDPDDKDGRTRDFEPVNRNLAKFQAAFNPEGAIRVWGCNHTDRDVDLFKRLFLHKEYRRTGMKDSQALVLHLPSKYDSEFTTRGLPVTKGRLACTFGELRHYIEREFNSCYNAKAARGAGVKAYGGAPGNGSDVGGKGGFPMYIVATPGHNLQIIEFYKKYLGVKFDVASFAEFAP